MMPHESKQKRILLPEEGEGVFVFYNTLQGGLSGKTEYPKTEKREIP
jgi:hypothetical protein